MRAELFVAMVESGRVLVVTGPRRDAQCADATDNDGRGGGSCRVYAPTANHCGPLPSTDSSAASTAVRYN
jgi:hypothetical protein